MKVETIGNARGPCDGITAIYALTEMDGSPRYVGKTSYWLHFRHKQHITLAKRDSPKLPVHRWLSRQMKKGQRLCIALLEYVPPGRDWAERERAWISKFRSEGRPLFNLTDGGEGLSGWRLTPEHRKKIADAIKTGSTFSCEICSTSFWRKRSEINKGDCRFCSRACYAKSNKGVSKPVPALCTDRGILAAAARRRALTHCKRGHPLSGENLFHTSNGGRGCKTCRRIHKTDYLARISANG